MPKIQTPSLGNNLPYPFEDLTPAEKAVVDRIRKMTPEQRFWYWIKERYQVYQKRKAGGKKPWTDDPIIRRIFFTAPYRELDKTTVWFRENIRHPLRNKPEVMFATVAFRWFNFIETGAILSGGGLFENKWTAGRFVPIIHATKVNQDLLLYWSEKLAIQRLTSIQEAGDKVFTGAYIIKSPEGMSKIEGICKQITNIWNARDLIIEQINGHGTLEGAWNVIRDYPYMGGFTTYEVVTDLRHTDLLNKAPDINTWCNLGPGARRGMSRMMGIPLGNLKNKKGRTKNGVPAPAGWKDKIQYLLGRAKAELPGMPTFELRDVEHSLCEVDKYERILWCQGKSKRLFEGT